MLESEIRTNFARNVRDLRISRKLNQIQLGEKLAYSSKAVSKWENGDVMPDIVTLKMIAEFFQISVDDLISNRNVVFRSHRKRNRTLITSVSSLLSYFVAALVFYILTLVNLPKAWISFIVAIPVSAIVLVVFSAIWYKRINVMISTIILVIGACITAMCFTDFYLWWITAIAGAIFIVLTIIFFSISHSKKNK